MFSNRNHNRPGFFPLPPTFCSLFTATVGVKMMSSAHQALTKESLWSCIMWPRCLSKKGILHIKMHHLRLLPIPI